jgi:cell division topological specificity factor
MSIFWRRMTKRRFAGSSSAAKERLQLVLVNDRTNMSPDKLQAMKAEIVAVIAKYVSVDSARIEINIEQRERDHWLVADVPLPKGSDRDHPLSTGLEDA